MDQTTDQPKEEVLSEQDQTRQRAQTFLKEYGELVEKHKIDFACYPVFVPDGNGGFRVTVQNTPVDISNQPVKSFIQPE